MSRHTGQSSWLVQSWAALLLCLLMARYLQAQPALVDKERLINELDKLVDEDGSVETALINYLFARQMVNKLRNQVGGGELPGTELQKKRSYWKQCAFNAVSCFGQKREGGSQGRRLYSPTAGVKHGDWTFFRRLFPAFFK